jgi:hypothetical protein
MPTGIYERKPTIPRMSNCHPDRKHFGKGMCNQCYHKAYHVQHKHSFVDEFGISIPEGFYTYLWFRADSTPYYVGKGNGKRAYVNHGHSFHRPVSRARIFVQYWESEEKALEIEAWYIAFYGRIDKGTGCLRNLTDGGENPPGNKGVKFSEEHKRKISEAQKGPKGHWFGTKRPFVSRGKGRVQNPEWIAKRVASTKATRECKKKGDPTVCKAELARSMAGKS